MNKYELYEESVVDSLHDISVMDGIFEKLKESPPAPCAKTFCGTFKLSTDWVKRHPRNRAMAIDLDPEPLEYGRTRHLSKLTTQQKERVKIINGNVLQKTRPSVDLIAALNFSYWFFKDRRLLRRYFKHCFNSLDRKGLLFLDTVGGWEMHQTSVERRKIYRGKKKLFTYVWKQESYNPVNNEGFFSMGFKLNNGTELKRVFSYPWRVWSIPEIRELLKEAGFRRSYVYWEADDNKGGGNGKFFRTEKEDNCEVWIAYIVAEK